jgi:hypothetical protein
MAAKSLVVAPHRSHKTLAAAAAAAAAAADVAVQTVKIPKTAYFTDYSGGTHAAWQQED